jgi:hypothetical protein
MEERFFYGFETGYIHRTDFRSVVFIRCRIFAEKSFITRISFSLPT